MRTRHILAGTAVLGAAVLAAVAPFPSKCVSVNGLPDSKCQPGVTNPDITQQNLNKTICNPSWSTKSIRPSTAYTNKLKAQQIKDYGYKDTKMSSYEEDHLISLELGGSPTDSGNLWPEPYTIKYGAKKKDIVENYLHKQVCSGAITLQEAQKEISTNWEKVQGINLGVSNSDD